MSKGKPIKITLEQFEAEMILECLEHQSYAIVKLWGIKNTENLIKKLQGGKK